jgi:threonine dehydrogenase-like Zn-dependent dehydrogenase
MRAAILRNRTMITGELADPVPGEQQVLVRTLACGICGSDLHAVAHLDRMVEMQNKTAPGQPTLDPARDLVMGHEFCVEIVEHGPGTARALPVGSRACSLPVILAGRDVHTVGYSNQFPGGYGELMLLNEMLLVPVPNGLSSELAALTEPLAVGRHAVEKARVGGDDLPLVIGCGPIGLAVIVALKQKGIGPIVAADFSAARRAMAERLGADEVIDPRAASPYQRWQDIAWPPDAERDNPLSFLFGERPRPGVVFECVGVPGIIAQICDGAMRETRVSVVGACMEADRFEPLVAIGKEINLQFCFGYTPLEFADTLRALGDGAIEAGAMITGRVGIEGVPQAFRDLASPDTHAKIICDPSLR